MPEELRRAIATEAARLLLRRKETHHAAARKRAARWLSRRRVQRDDMPTRREIDDQFDLLARLDSAEHQRERLRELQTIAVDLGLRLADFEPRFHGPVVDGPVLPGIEIAVALGNDASAAAVESRLRADPDVKRLDCPESDEWRFRFRRCPVVLVFGEPASDSIDLAALQALSLPESAFTHEDDDVGNDEAAIAYDHLRYLLARLEDVRLPTATHPEGDALYHALQVFELGRAERPWDEEFLVACLVRDVGLAVEPRLGVTATLEALAELVTPRVLELVEGLPRMQEALRAGRLPKSMRNSPEADDLRLLARCDREGRVPGRATCTLDEAIDYLAALSSACEADWESE